MAMTEVYSGIQQTTPYSCGAASCLFILKMLGQDKSGQTADQSTGSDLVISG